MSCDLMRFQWILMGLQLHWFLKKQLTKLVDILDVWWIYLLWCGL